MATYAGGTYYYEFCIPFNSGDPQDLTVSPGDILGLKILFREMYYDENDHKWHWAGEDGWPQNCDRFDASTYGKLALAKPGTSNQPPTASFTFTPASPTVGEDVTFDASASYDPDGQIVSYRWDFGDGETGQGVTTTHTYTQPGTYTVVMTVTDNQGTTASQAQTVVVNALDTTFTDDFSRDTGLWSYYGSAYRDAQNDHVVLTPNTDWQVGNLWLLHDVTSPFTIEFRYKAGGGTGAEGITFMFYKDKDYQPGNGGRLGFNTATDEGVPGYAVEFDNWHNGEYNDPTERHIALIKDSVANHLCWVEDPRTEDNQWHQVKIEVGESSVVVYVDGNQVINWAGDIDRKYGGLGFSASSGIANNWHLIDDVKIGIKGVSAGDTTPPAVAGTDPANGATGVPVDGAITVTFTEDVQPGPAFDGISLKDAGGSAVAVTKNINGRVLTIKPNANLAYGATYTVTIPAGAVQDESGNALAQDYTFSFTTQAASGGGGGGGGTPAVQVTLSLPSDTAAAPGSIVTVPVAVRNAAGVAGFEFTLSWDAAWLTDPKAEKGSLIAADAGWTVTAETASAGGSIRVMGYNTAGQALTAFEGELVKLTFKVAQSAPAGAAADLRFTDVTVSDASGQALPVTTTDGRIIVAARKKGDVNGDGVVNVLDVVKTVNIALGRVQPTDEERYAADANGDGVINVLDVVRIVNMALGRA